MSTRTINSDGHFKSGFFVLRDSIKPVEWSGTSNLLVTSPSNTQIKKWILESIDSAKSYIKICSFILTDKEIYRAIKRSIIEKDIVVFILTQLDSKKINTSFLTPEEVSSNSSQLHLDIIGDLFSIGAHIRASENIHAKFSIVDGEIALITSANLTSPSLELNNESGIIIENESEIKRLESLFDIIYRHGTTYKRFTKSVGNKRFVQLGTLSLENELLDKVALGNLRFTYKDAINGIYEEIIGIISSAEQFIFLSTYSIVKLGAIPELLNTVAEAISRGVNVNVFCRAMNYRSDHLIGVESLRNSGCEIYGDLFNHSKGILSEKKGMLFTANIDGNHGLISGFEVGSLLTQPQYEDFHKFHQWQIDNAFFIYKEEPLKKEVFKTYDFYVKEKEVRPVSLPRRITIKAGEESLTPLLDSYPLYIIVENREVIGILVDNIKYRCELINDTLVVKERFQTWNNEIYMYQYDEIQIEQ